ncbi:hypothetical protein CFC21_083270 [Triticum aestivum]|uniref:Uncharacterized protein n=3 Tax=Triticum TaxID=4564 RepID=A0A9R0XZQ4_TRITD|nr:hypothetical protein CFC21_083270 [Triticum aestivum]VAI45545.1 unnamed protein product [Triticum turgidum subsp. durum]
MVDRISFDRCPFRPSSTCTQCPTECRTKTPRKKRAGARAARSIQRPRRTRRATNRPMTKKSTRLLTGRGEPNTLTTRRAFRTWWPRRLVSLRSVLGRLPQRRLKRLQSSPKLRRLQCRKLPPPNCQKLCPGSK